MKLKDFFFKMPASISALYRAREIEKAYENAVARNNEKEKGMIDKEYFTGIGLGNLAREYGGDRLVERTVRIRLPEKIMAKTERAAEWRSMPLEQSIERDLFALAIHQAKNLSMCREVPQDGVRNV
jgi:hypothetical protein